NQAVDWSLYRTILLFGQFPTTLRTQYSSQYNFTIKRELPGNILFQIGYVGSQGHRLLAIFDQNAGNAQTCLDLTATSTLNPGLNLPTCGAFGEDSAYTVPAGAVIPAGGFHLPYNAGTGGTVIPGGTVLTNPINLV